MQPAHESPTRGRSAFAAAFLSLLFPGLGHAYLGAYRRALGFAAPPLLVGALVAGFAVRMDALVLAGFAVQSWFQVAVFVANLVAFAYRAFAIFDAWAIAQALGGRRPAPGAALLRSASLASVAGLAAVVLVMATAHVAVARYDVLLAGTTDCIFNPDATGCSADGSPEPGDRESATPGDQESATPGASVTPEPTQGPPVGGATAPPAWDGKSRLNILLIGADEQGGGHNTDTLITLSIDPATSQVVMFQLPRDTVDVPIPPGPARNFFGSVYRGKINSFYATIRNRADLYPGSAATRGYNGLKAVLGNLYGLDIRYFAEVNFAGFRKVVDALGGVTVNVQVPVLDDNFPGPGGARVRLYIPIGMQHMTGSQALDYARSRKSTTDFDRSARQQRVLVSLRQQLDVGAVLGHIDELAAAIGSSVRTDVPRDLVPQLLGLADKVNARSIRSVTFTPPYYQQEFLNSDRGYIIVPRVSRIRAAVAEAFQVDPQFAERRDAIAQEAATVWVLNGSGRTGEAARLSDYLSYLGIAATAPNQKPDTSGLTATTVRAYNGAEAQYPLTLAALEEVFGVTVVPLTDASVRADFIVITGKTTPQLTAPPLP